MGDRNTAIECFRYKTRWMAGYVYSIGKMYGKTFVKRCLGKYRKIDYLKYIPPTVLQLPITYKCNCDCVMCNMRYFQGQKGFTSEELSEILSDPLFKNIKSVGINGGEPFLLADLPDYVSALESSLPKLREIHIISNGYFVRRIEELLPRIRQITGRRNIKLFIYISVDGIDKVHDLMRGVDGMFTKTKESCELLKNKPELYDSFNVICTVTRHNVMKLPEVEAWAKREGYCVSYNVATIHERLANEDKYDDFTVFKDEKSLQIATEFFYTKFLETKSETYFALYYFLKYRNRVSRCDYQNLGVTLTPDGQLAYCATHSKALGSAVDNSAKTLFMNNLSYRKELCSSMCDSCSHYSSQLTYEGKKEYLKEIYMRLDSPFWD